MCIKYFATDSSILNYVDNNRDSTNNRYDDLKKFILTVDES